MSSRTQIVLTTIGLFVLATGIPHSLAAAEETASSGSSGATEGDDESDTSDEEDAPQASDEEGSDGGSTENRDRESEHGSYEWKPSYGGGLEYGLFYTGLDRWNLHLLSPNDAPSVDVSTVSAFTFAAEASLIEGSRLTLFAGFEKPFQSNPNVLAVYGGLEPAFAFRRGMWELSLGLGIGLGSVSISTESQGDLNAGLVILRPTLEVRRYVGELFAAFVRIGFNQWLPHSASGDLEIETPEESRPGLPAENLLYEGGFYTSLGVRFGYYPEPVKTIPDTDGDGLRDDIDDCVEQPEDEDGYKDYDGCPDEDNDDDGIEDEQDECPDKAEDIDQWEDEDGCPDEAGDPDDDGIVNEKDECPKYAEDKDGFEDEDGCPDPDNDGDGIEDAEDDCPGEVGIPSEGGCPSTIATVEEDHIAVEPKIRFEVEGEGPEQTPGSTLTSNSKPILDELAAVLKVRDGVTNVEIQGHTAEGDEDEMQELSKKRAESVRSYLIEAGVAGDRLVAEGYGFSKPVESDETGADTDKQPKARIEFKITERDDTED